MVTPPKVRRITLLAGFVFAFCALARAEPADEPANVAVRARAMLERGEVAAATPLLEKTVAKTPSNAELHYLLGRSYSLEARTSTNTLRLAFLGWNIGSEYEAALALDPSRNDVRLELVRYYEMAPRLVGGSPSKARQLAADLAGRDAAAGQWARGYLAYREKAYGPARVALREAVKLAKDDATRALALTWLGWLSQETQQYDDAFAAFDGLAALGRPAGLYEAGRTALFAGRDLDRGQSALRRYLASKHGIDDPSPALAHLQLGLLAERRGDRAAAREEVATALRLDPSVEGGAAARKRLR
jgi:tetratricopeptide (TPR) repeat protein